MHEANSKLLPNAAPISPYRRLFLYAFRRLATGGIGDADAAHAIFIGFGLSYRRPLILLRALTAELARVSAVKLSVAPCCCPRMTLAEAVLLDAVGQAPCQAGVVHENLKRLLHVRTCLGVVSGVQAVAAAFSDLGMPLGEDCK